MREQLADLCHRQWTGWMRYMFSKGISNFDGTWTMPAKMVERWTRQMNTPYSQLSQSEQDSDRSEADRFMEVIQEDTMVEMQTIDANDKSAPWIDLFLDGEEVSGNAARCFVSVEPNVEVPGWADLYPDEMIAGPDGELPSAGRKNGLVMWRPAHELVAKTKDG